ncbi:type II toxin-antitoxin system HicB family antitoxin [Rhizorhabdus argentea]|uniref:type II toxin-antitoxin system HicB family antitoxin n=1 Tax=Rhizorhabdus argentea TaxID=1387174 RepID=UPI0030EE3F48
MAVVERAHRGFSAFFPSLPSCTATGNSLEQLKQNAEGAVFDYLELSATMHSRMLHATADAIPHGLGIARMIIQPRGD